MDPALMLACLLLVLAIIGAVWLVTHWSGREAGPGRGRRGVGVGRVRRVRKQRG